MAESVGGLLRERAREHPDQIYLGCEDQCASYAQMDERSDRVAAGLRDLGVSRADRIAVISSNRMEFLELYFACAKLGAILVPINAYLKGEFMRYQLDDAQAETLIADEAGLKAAPKEGIKRIIAFDPDPDAIPFEELRTASTEAPTREPEPSDVLSILYTSGTTGLSKGCMLPHGYYLNGATVASEMCEYRSDDILFTALPLFHTWAQGLIMGALVHHLTAFVDPIFSVGRLLQRFSETNASVFSGVGAMGMAMLGAPESDADRAHRLRLALMIPFGTKEQEQFEKRFGAHVLSQLYGQTECGAIAYTRLNDPTRNRASIGRAAPFYDLKLFDDRGLEVPHGQVGEICVRPLKPNVMFAGYWRKPEETLSISKDLWHHTGDYGRMFEDGSIAFVDRKKDALRRRGENVSSVELETAIIAHPKIAEAAVHAIPSEMTEDDIKACIVLTPDASVTPKELFEFFKGSLPYFAVPRYVEIVPELPRNATTRVMKHVLRDRGITSETWDFEKLGLEVEKASRR
ncbi:MAG: AMP-binding protein [Actinomycetota bacterium]